MHFYPSIGPTKTCDNTFWNQTLNQDVMWTPFISKL